MLTWAVNGFFLIQSQLARAKKPTLLKRETKARTRAESSGAESKERVLTCVASAGKTAIADMWAAQANGGDPEVRRENFSIAISPSPKSIYQIIELLK